MSSTNSVLLSSFMEDEENENWNQTIYICHYCLNYTSLYKSDMKRHLHKKNKCKFYSATYSFEDAMDLSLCRTYTFSFDYTHFEQKEFAFIVSHYTNVNNFISEDFINEEKIQKNNQAIILLEKIKEDKSKEEKMKFICPYCSKEYSSKQNLVKHSENKNLCEYNQKYNKILQQTIEKSEKEKIENHFQNIHNIQNNHNNNHNTSNVHISVNDFMNKKYDLTHISDEYYKQKDFFLFHNFLEQIMLNKNNHNIYFVDNNTNAIIYTENELNKVSSEKIGYIILEKVEQAFRQIFHQQDESIQKFYDFIHKYYYVIKGQYKHDTIYKMYDVDEKRFYYTSNSNLCRSRDKHLCKIINIINKHHSETKSNLSIYNHDHQEILTCEPNIEDFISRRCRYKELKS